MAICLPALEIETHSSKTFRTNNTVKNIPRCLDYLSKCALPCSTRKKTYCIDKEKMLKGKYLNRESFKQLYSLIFACLKTIIILYQNYIVQFKTNSNFLFKNFNPLMNSLKLTKNLYFYATVCLLL